MQTLPDVQQRIETGPLKIGHDWPGVFIRGDEALGFSSALKAMKIQDNSIIDEIIRLFRECRI
jgi:hypothetical protein